MPWESRAGTDKRYYTRTTRVDGKLVRTYFGSGPKAERAARADEIVRQVREAAREKRAKRSAELAECKRATVAHYRFVEIYYRAKMLSDGYHYHRGQWRKSRATAKADAEEARHTSTADVRRGSSAKCESPGGVSGGEDQPKASCARPQPPTAKPRRRPVPVRNPFQFRGGLVRSLSFAGRNQRSAVPADSGVDPGMRVGVDSNTVPERRCASSGLLPTVAHTHRARGPPHVACRPPTCDRFQCRCSTEQPASERRPRKMAEKSSVLEPTTIRITNLDQKHLPRPLKVCVTHLPFPRFATPTPRLALPLTCMCPLSAGVCDLVSEAGTVPVSSTSIRRRPP